MKYKLVLVEWNDASNIAVWQNEQEIDEWTKDKAYQCKNVGWLIRETKEFYIVCARVSNDEQYGLCEKLPKKMITKLHKLN